MILKYTSVESDPHVHFVVDNVTSVQVETITNPEWLMGAGIDAEKTPAIALVYFEARGETQSAHCKLGQVYLMNDSGKTIDKF